jgi:hypothetical protein
VLGGGKDAKKRFASSRLYAGGTGAEKEGQSSDAPLSPSCGTHGKLKWVHLCVYARRQWKGRVVYETMKAPSKPMSIIRGVAGL